MAEAIRSAVLGRLWAVLTRRLERRRARRAATARLTATLRAWVESVESEPIPEWDVDELVAARRQTMKRGRVG